MSITGSNKHHTKTIRKLAFIKISGKFWDQLSYY